MQNKLPLIISTFCFLAFMFISLFKESSTFNMIPYFIHESIWPGGKNEELFIILFDIAFGILIFFSSYKLTKFIFK